MYCEYIVKCNLFPVIKAVFYTASLLQSSQSHWCFGNH